MAKIIISELHSVDSDNFLTEIDDIDSTSIYGGNDLEFSQFMNFALNLLNTVLRAYAIHNITLLAKSFNTNVN